MIHDTSGDKVAPFFVGVRTWSFHRYSACAAGWEGAESIQMTIEMKLKEMFPSKDKHEVVKDEKGTVEALCLVQNHLPTAFSYFAFSLPRSASIGSESDMSYL